MKKVLLGTIITSTLFGGCIQYSATDYTNSATSTNCFNATDISIMSTNSYEFNPFSISTKIAGKDFQLRITRKISTECSNLQNLQFSLVDEDTNETLISSSLSFLPTSTFTKKTLSVDSVHKDVIVKFTYDKDEWSYSKEKVPCSSYISTTMSKMMGKVTKTLPALSSITESVLSTLKDGAVYMDKFGSCYKIHPKKDTYTYTEYSTDNFAIRPDRFDINLAKSNVKTGELVPLDIKVKNYNGDIIDFDKKSTDLVVDISPTTQIGQYYFDIVDGITKREQLFFTKEENNVKLNISEKIGDEFAIIDNDDTINSCRIFDGQSNSVNVTGSSKYWAGAGIGNDEDDPMKNNVQVDVVQNTKKDLHFQKLNW